MDEQTAREHVVAAADRLFYTRGIQAVGMDAVRSAAGVSLKRMYALFPSKDDLVIAVLHRRTAQWNAGIAATAAGASTPREKLLAIFDFLSDWFREDDFRGCAFINSYGELGATSTAVAETARAQKAAFQRYVAELVRDAGAPEHLAPQLALLAEGAQTTAAISGDAAAAGHARAAAETLITVALGRETVGV
ncbi:AcrR family transcriptional regulator [Diaminobutyricimonas aerilata]|uniref:AcrR family transcriptional regulator n=1 Tax=Diaminobutyricimonas aerilata TaxID=1162967 RepID=A0A2M9CKK1_9MICO|nr:TetR/AcrR family transcriptional regulator [Diaminobutyricimonas aerilata]PJJ72422.1 AcrR family transcriptional regulator [Diaminobutyricimonas aerilata]